MGLPLSAGALVFETLGVRPLRTSWLIVGTLVFSVLSGVAVSGHSPVALPRRPGPEGNLHGGEGEALIVGSHTGTKRTFLQFPRHAKMWHTLHKNPANRKRRSGPAFQLIPALSSTATITIGNKSSTDRL